MEVQRSAVSVQKGRSPIDAWPDAFIFFDRYDLLLLITLFITVHICFALVSMIISFLHGIMSIFLFY